MDQLVKPVLLTPTKTYLAMVHAHLALEGKPLLKGQHRLVAVLKPSFLLFISEQPKSSFTILESFA
jgi:hypothetical protein